MQRRATHARRPWFSCSRARDRCMSARIRAAGAANAGGIGWRVLARGARVCETHCMTLGDGDIAADGARAGRSCCARRGATSQDRGTGHGGGSRPEGGFPGRAKAPARGDRLGLEYLVSSWALVLTTAKTMREPLGAADALRVRDFGSLAAAGRDAAARAQRVAGRAFFDTAWQTPART